MASSEAVVYLRVSTDEQARSGLGVEAQQAACLRYCELKGHRVLQVVRDEGVSGRDNPESRVGLSAILTYVRAHPECRVVVYSLSRLSRRQSDIWRLLDDRGPYALRLESASEPFETTTAMGRAMMGMLGVFAQLEADMTADRTRAALAARKARGLRVGPRFMIEVEPELIASIVKMRDEENMSCTAIAAELNQQGVPGVRGGRWHETSVRRAIDQYRKVERDRRLEEARDKQLERIRAGAGDSVESTGEASGDGPGETSPPDPLAREGRLAPLEGGEEGGIGAPAEDGGASGRGDRGENHGGAVSLANHDADEFFGTTIDSLGELGSD